MLKKYASITLLLATAQVHAETAHPLYAGVLLQSNSLKVHTVSGNATFEPAMTGLALGYEFGDYFALEGRALLDSNADSIGPVSLKVRSQFHLLARAHYPVLEQLRVFASVSHVRSNYTMRVVPNGVGGTSSGFDLSGAGYGVGAEYLLTPQWKLAVEQQWLPEDDLNDRLTNTNISTDAKALTFKASYSF
ncbi:MAG: porin family protein [Rheinheimera sp.]|nr:porin family protein [Rheinheimera sp.]